jgi:hypothetical protein
MKYVTPIEGIHVYCSTNCILTLLASKPGNSQNEKANVISETIRVKFFMAVAFARGKKSIMINAPMMGRKTM